MKCDFCHGDDHVAYVKLIGLISDSAKNVVEHFVVHIEVCYLCRVIEGVLEEFEKEK